MKTNTYVLLVIVMDKDFDDIDRAAIEYDSKEAAEAALADILETHETEGRKVFEEDFHPTARVVVDAEEKETYFYTIEKGE